MPKLTHEMREAMAIIASAPHGYIATHDDVSAEVARELIRRGMVCEFCGRWSLTGTGAATMNSFLRVNTLGPMRGDPVPGIAVVTLAGELRALCFTLEDAEAIAEALSP